MPGITHLLNDIKVEVAHDQLFVISAAQIADKLPFWIAEIALAVEIIIAMFFDADAVD